MTERGPLSRGVCVVLLLVAAVILVQSAVEIASAYRSREWPTTDAEVMVSTVAYVVGHSVRPYDPQITYTYHVGDGVYVSDRLWFGSSRFLLKSSALELANRYPVGAHLRISYSPDDPHVSVIQPGIQWESIAKTGLAGAIIVLTLWLSGRVGRPLAKAEE